MNKRQKLVQKHFLNNEKAVIQRLQGIYGDSLREIQDKIKNLSFSIGKLQQEYDWLDPSDPKRAEIKSMIQSKIYQKQYQAQLEKQVDGILKQMQTSQFVNVSDYLDTCYTDGFIGTIFDAYGQGVPILAPINQESMVRAVQLESKISKGLYTKLGQDVNLLKTRIMAEVSRGISTGKSYAQVAKGLENYTRIGYNNSIRIARTEGHRIQCTAAMDAMEAAKERGADVLKQWDSTLDGRTRDSHRAVDGEIRELDKKFSNGLRFAGDPHGMAGEVVNCRCAVLQRARWALDEDELQVLKDKARYFGLDKSSEFDDFKRKYLKAVETSDVVTDDIIKFISATTIEEARDFALDGLGLEQTTAYDLGINIDVANGINEAVFKISSEIGSLVEYGYLKNIILSTNNSGAYARYSKSSATVVLNRIVKREDALSILSADALEEFKAGTWSSGSPFHSIYHELGHAVEHMMLDDDVSLKNKIDTLYSKTYRDIMGNNTIWTDSGDDILKLAKKAKDAGFSYYGLRDSGEFVAEAVAQYYCSDKPSDITKQIIKILKEG